ncbi:MAG: hypothetical protein JRZ94_06470, partial [Nitrososphaerota archaeon]|nr:hypothetical protein [Nitrososphaerota archaeon]
MEKGYLIALVFGISVTGFLFSSNAFAATNTNADGFDPSISGNTIAFSTSEFESSSDLNGDGDQSDTVIRLYNTATSTVQNTDAVGVNPSISGNIVAFQTFEDSIAIDLNGDGDINDTVIRLYNTATSTISSTGGAVGVNPSISGNIVAFYTPEGSMSTDLNGDGDQSDTVIRLYNIATFTRINTGAVGVNPSISGNIVAFQTNEGLISTDLNSDGDYFDNVIRIYNTATSTVQNTGAVGIDPSISGNLITFQTYEGSIATDLNGDGDQSDNVIRIFDLATFTITNTATDGSNPSISGNLITFHIFEGSIATDLTGDGDQSDDVIFTFDTTTSIRTNTATVGSRPSISGNLITFQTYEGSIATDL